MIMLKKYSTGRQVQTNELITEKCFKGIFYRQFFFTEQ